jgi:hypothetical protein
VEANSMGELIMVRHGESESNGSRIFAGSSEVPLTEVGRRQARQLAGRISLRFKPQRVVSSKFKRALETAEIIADTLQLPLEVIDGLEERNWLPKGTAMGAQRSIPGTARARSALGFPSSFASLRISAGGSGHPRKPEFWLSGHPAQTPPQRLNLFATNQRRSATSDQTASTSPKGHAPWRKP